MPLIALSAIFWLVVEIRAIRTRRKRQKLKESWPKFQELYISALESGVSIPDGFRFAQDFGLEELKGHVDNLVSQLDRGLPVQSCLRNFGAGIQLGATDLFIEIIDLAHRTGSQNLIAALQEHSAEVRSELSAQGEVSARGNAILTVAKLGLLSPWVLLAVLCFNEGNRNGFNTDSGGLLLVGGFAISFLAYRLVVLAGQTKPLPRVFGVNHGI